MLKTFLAVVVGLSVVAGPAPAFQREDVEEEGGETFALFGNTQDKIYGLSFEKGTWIKNWPIFGDYILSVFKSDKEDTTYGAAGMLIRVMPRTFFAPFVGGGGTYNYSLSSKDNKTTGEETGEATENAGEPADKGDSHWAAIAEAGFRISPLKSVGVFEIFGRYTWPSLEGDREYWVAGFAVSTGI